jgi:hypothetical protein
MPYFKSLATPHPNGFNNCKLEGTMASSGVPDPTYSHLFVDDFDTFLTGVWTNTIVGTGTASVLAGGDGGQLNVTTSAGATDSLFLQRPAATNKLNAGKQMFFKFAGILTDVTNEVFLAGMCNSSTTFAGITDGIYIQKPSGAAALNLVINVGGTAVTVPFPATAVPVASTYFEVGFMVDWLGNVAGYFNPLTGTQVILNAVSSPNAGRGRDCQSLTPPLTTAALAPTFGIQNSSAAAHTLYADYIVCSNER